MPSRRLPGVLWVFYTLALYLMLEHRHGPMGAKNDANCSSIEAVAAPVGSHHRLIIGVLSARHHRRQRDAIRETWACAYLWNPPAFLTRTMYGSVLSVGISAPARRNTGHIRRQ